MALDVTPGEIVTFQRDELRDRYLRDYANRVPDADVGPGTQPYVDASIAADGAMVLMNDAVTIGRGTNLRTSAGQWLKDIGETEGIFPRPAVGANGFVQIEASVGGGTILAGDELTEPTSGLRYRVTTTSLYTNGSLVPVIGIDTGPSTNLEPGTVLVFSAPRPGIAPNATVFEQTDGSGLSGGRNADDDEAYRNLIIAARSNPAASGNDAAYQRAIESTPGIAVEKAFTYPAILGTGTTGFTFTMRASSGASRAPNATEIAAVLANLIGQMPADDGIFACSITEQGVNVTVAVRWKKGAASWVDVSPWPDYIAGDKVLVDGALSPTATTFRVTTGTSTTSPVAGQTIGIFDPSTQTFIRKRIASVTTVVANKSWTLTIDTTNNASDTNYVPQGGQAVSPWSDSLDSVIPAVQGYFDGLGPGEQVATFLDPGSRQKRQPESPDEWPNTIGNNVLNPIFDLSTIADASLLEPTIPYATGIGTPGVFSYMLTLADLAIFPMD